MSETQGYQQAPMHLPWTEPRPLSPLSGGPPMVNSEPGVYRIRAFNGQGQAMCIARAGGIDRDGILHIGESEDLGRRIRDFRRCVENRTTGHKAGVEFWRYGFHDLFLPQNLRFDYVVTGTKERATELEYQLHQDYRKRHLDRPPLDGTSGRSPE